MSCFFDRILEKKDVVPPLEFNDMPTVIAIDIKPATEAEVTPAGTRSLRLPRITL
jgi:hypothetical protein